MKGSEISICKKIRDNNPLVHCITNPISMMQCANAILGLGARPIMAEHPLEVKEITSTAKALLLNLGNISDSRMEAMGISFDEALGKRIPVVIDAVGIACSQLRRGFLIDLLRKYEVISEENRAFLLVKGNYSEIMALYDEKYKSEGVDAKAGITLENIEEATANLALKYKAAVLASGKADVVSDGTEVMAIDNGCEKLGSITGTGCMLGAICATFLSVQEDIRAIAYACAAMGIAGEIADSESCAGVGSYLVGLLDRISLMNDEVLARYSKFR